MKTGKIKSYNELSKYGFITVDGTGEDIFVHESGLTCLVRKGDAVSFMITEGKKGPNATNVKRLS
jgi:CspA family cold shock protein